MATAMSIKSVGRSMSGFACPVEGCPNTRTAVQPRCRVHMKGLKHTIEDINFHEYPDYPNADYAPVVCSCGWTGVSSTYQAHRRSYGEDLQRRGVKGPLLTGNVPFGERIV